MADISSRSIKTIDEINKFYRNINIPVDIKTAINEMEDLGLIDIVGNKLNITKISLVSVVLLLIYISVMVAF